jgi:hypothetical protein
MKKLVPLLALVLIFIGCSLDDEPATTFTYDLVPVDSVAIPDTLVFKELYTFEITYQRPTSCHAFAGFDYQRDGNERIIGVICAVYDNQDCEELVDETAVAELDFKVERNDYYVFKFWQGEDEEGEPIFLTDTIPVALE